MLVTVALFLTFPTTSNIKIVGGQTAVPGQFPFLVSIRLPEYNEHYCSGSIIHPNFVLTAAFCLTCFRSDELDVVAGAHYINDGDAVDGTVYKIEIIIHKDFNITTDRNDIALARTNVDIVYTPRVQPISIGRGEHVGAGLLARAAGWGEVDVSCKFSLSLTNS